MPLELARWRRPSSSRPDVVLDLSDEPVLGPPRALRAREPRARARRPVRGRRLPLRPAAVRAAWLPTLAVIGTGKRVGKTAVTGHVARRLARDAPDRRRGDGPRRAGRARARRRRADGRRPPRALARRPARGLRPSRDGDRRRRADGRLPPLRRRARRRRRHLERARGRRGCDGRSIPTSSCSTGAARRCRPIAADRRHPRRRRAARIRGRDRLPERVPRADRRPRRRDDGRGRRAARASSRRAAGAHARPGVRDRARRAAAAAARAGRRASGRVLRHAPPEPQHARIAAHLEDAHGARVTHVSGQPLRPRRACATSSRALDADVFVVELKAAAVDVVVEEASRRGVRVVLAANDVVPLPGEPDLDVELERLAAEASALVRARPSR